MSTTPCKTTPDSQATHSGTSDLQIIIREFEKDFHSPSAHSEARAADKSKPKNFVRKIVASIEVNYQMCNYHHGALDEIDGEEASGTECPKLKRKAKSFGSCSEISRNVNNSPTKKDNESRRRSGTFSAPSCSSAEDSKNNRRSAFIASLFRLSDDKKRDCGNTSKQIGEGSTTLTPAEKTEVIQRKACSSGVASSLSPSSTNYEDSKAYRRSRLIDFMSSCDGLCSSENAALQMEVESATFTVSKEKTEKEEITANSVTAPDPKKTVAVEGHAPLKTSTMIEEHIRAVWEEVLRDPPRVRVDDRTPEIVGAFLKKPIEVENTSVEWIPITSRKLPRKQSLKKMLTSWISKQPFYKNNSVNNLLKETDLFKEVDLIKQKNLIKAKNLIKENNFIKNDLIKEKNSIKETNLNKETTVIIETTRELQDSGYEEKSASSTSLSSVMSAKGALEQPKDDFIEMDRKATLSTFRAENHLTSVLNETSNDDCQEDATPESF
ncbi:uncharacterized protein LOC117221148 [Megalopta genalis]|uniref:uncharacterized protein LOC117221148 n=1 Tax=Megalopta genalis TaxID=115081 RepID=UPI003FCFF4C9